MNQAPNFDPTVLIHVRTVISIIVGISVGRLLTGLARFVQHPSRQKICGVHLVWAFFMLLQMIYFWWWEFHLNIVQWTFAIYCFTALYASAYFFLCTLLFPDTIHEYTGFEDYFMSRRKWFFGILIGTFILDIADTFIKGTEYAQSIGPEYWVRFALYVVASAAAIKTENQRFQLAFAIVALIGETGWAFSLYYTLT